jgi:hypothetical protein
LTCSRRIAAGILLGIVGCSSPRNSGQPVASGVLPAPEKLFAAGNVETLRFHSRLEGAEMPRVVDIWSDAKFVTQADASIRYEYSRLPGVAQPLLPVLVSCDLRVPISSSGTVIQRAFLQFFRPLAPDLVQRVENAFATIVGAAVAGSRAFETEKLVAEVEVAYEQTREASFARITFYETRFYRKNFWVPGAPLPERLSLKGNVSPKE